MYDKLVHYHDWKLDCGAPTFDEAIVKLANLVLKEYGDYIEDEDKNCGGDEHCVDCRYIHGMMSVKHKDYSTMVHKDELTEEEREKAEPMF